MEFAPVAPPALSGRAGGHRDGLRGACGVTGPGAAWLGLFSKAFEAVCGARARRGDGACGGARRTGGHACWAGRRAGAHYGGLASAGTRGQPPMGGAPAADLRGRPAGLPDMSRAHADHRVSMIACITQASVIDQILAPLRTRAATATHAAARSPPSTRRPSGPGLTRRPAAAHRAR